MSIFIGRFVEPKALGRTGGSNPSPSAPLVEQLRGSLCLDRLSILMARIDSLIFGEFENGLDNSGNMLGFTTEKVSFQFVADSPCCGLTLSR